MGSLITQVVANPQQFMMSFSMPITLNGIAVNFSGNVTPAKSSRDIHYNALTSSFVIDTAGDYAFIWSAGVSKNPGNWPIDVVEMSLNIGGVTSLVTAHLVFNTAVETEPAAVVGSAQGFLIGATVGQSLLFSAQAFSTSNAAFTGFVFGSMRAYLVS